MVYLVTIIYFIGWVACMYFMYNDKLDVTFVEKLATVVTALFWPIIMVIAIGVVIYNKITGNDD